MPAHISEPGARRLPGARLVRVPGAAHSVYFEKPEAFNRIVLDFLNDEC